MSDPLALVTGAGRGIGKAVAVRLSRANIPVVLVARSNEEITSLRNDLRAAGGIAWACPCDVTDSREVESLRDDIQSEIGTVTILVNNAGIAPTAKLEETTDELWRETFAVNADGAFYMIRAFLPAMKGIGGHVISVASTAAYHGYRFTAAYSASKHALLGLMRAASEEFRNSAVTFSTICPGFTRTSILEESIQGMISRGKSREEAEQAFGSMNEEGRLIEPVEIADTVFQLIAERNLPSGRSYRADGTVMDR